MNHTDDVNPEQLQKLMQEHYQEPVTCRHFGCGRVLTLQEQLFGQYCIHHQQKSKTKKDEFIQEKIHEMDSVG